MRINTMELAKMIWDQSPHNWNDFRQTLLSHPERFGGVLDHDQVQQLVDFSKHMEMQGEGFPHSVERLHQLLAEWLPKRSTSFVP